MHFQQFINEVYKGLPFASWYLENILIFSEYTKKYFEHLRAVINRIRMAVLKLKGKKCDFFKCKLHYLGHLIPGKALFRSFNVWKGICPLPDKLQCIKDLPVPKILKKIRQMLGLIGYYWKFFPTYADLVWPLTQITHKTISFMWTGQHQKDFDILMDALMKSHILLYLDPHRPYIIFIDSSKYA